MMLLWAQAMVCQRHQGELDIHGILRSRVLSGILQGVLAVGSWGLRMTSCSVLGDIPCVVGMAHTAGVRHHPNLVLEGFLFPGSVPRNTVAAVQEAAAGT